MTLVKKYPVTIINIEEPIKDIFTLTLEGDKPIKYKPGQFLHMAIDQYTPTYGWPESRCFSIRGKLAENIIQITFSVKGTFTQRLASELRLKSKVWIKLPYGALFNSNHSSNECIFLAGGTGITPFLSLFTNSVFKEYSNPSLYLGIKKAEHNIYQRELDYALKNNPTLKIFIFRENIEGYISIESILKQHDKHCYFFLSGPPAMISSFNSELQKSNIPPGNIITDSWE